MGKEITPIHASDEDSSGKHFEEKPERSIGEEIQNDLTQLVGDFKQALDNLFLIIEDVDMDVQEIARRFDQAKYIYNKHFA